MFFENECLEIVVNLKGLDAFMFFVFVVKLFREVVIIYILVLEKKAFISYVLYLIL